MSQNQRLQAKNCWIWGKTPKESHWIEMDSGNQVEKHPISSSIFPDCSYPQEGFRWTSWTASKNVNQQYDEHFFRISILNLGLWNHFTDRSYSPYELKLGPKISWGQSVILYPVWITSPTHSASPSRLWVHETCRQFRDRLVNKEDG